MLLFSFFFSYIYLIHQLAHFYYTLEEEILQFFTFYEWTEGLKISVRTTVESWWTVCWLWMCLPMHQLWGWTLLVELQIPPCHWL